MHVLWCVWLQTCSVLPSPISSARMALQPLACIEASLRVSRRDEVSPVGGKAELVGAPTGYPEARHPPLGGWVGGQPSLAAALASVAMPWPLRRAARQRSPRSW